MAVPWQPKSSLTAELLLGPRQFGVVQANIAEKITEKKKKKKKKKTNTPRLN